VANSVLPQRILPEGVPWGTVDKSGKVTIDHNWYLFLYNIALQTIGVSLTTDQTQLLDTLESLADSTDQIADPRKIASLYELVLEPPDPPVPTLYAQDLDILSDPIARAQPESAITPGASPYTYTALFEGWMLVQGGTVSAIALQRTSSHTTGLMAGVFPMSRLDQITVTYIGAPTMVFFPR
jgi:hypothetical protein